MRVRHSLVGPLFLLLLASSCASRPRVDLTWAAELAGHDYALCDALLNVRGLDLEEENRPALDRVARLDPATPRLYDIIIVPGYTPVDQTVPTPELHPYARERLIRAAVAWDDGLAPFILLSGGYVHPDDNPFNEALQMKRFLVDRGFPEDAVLIEPCARHSHTNLRNAGRLMASTGLLNGLIITSYDQAFYYRRYVVSGFQARCELDFGALPGTLRRHTLLSTTFVPNATVMQRGPDPLDP